MVWAFSLVLIEKSPGRFWRRAGSKLIGMDPQIGKTLRSYRNVVESGDATGFV
jgi:hypothetical protein